MLDSRPEIGRSLGTSQAPSEPLTPLTFAVSRAPFFPFSIPLRSREFFSRRSPQRRSIYTCGGGRRIDFRNETLEFRVTLSRSSMTIQVVCCVVATLSLATHNFSLTYHTGTVWGLCYIQKDWFHTECIWKERHSN